MSMLLIALIVAAAVWVLVGLVGHGHASDPSTSVRGFSEALHALERAPRRRAGRRNVRDSGTRRP